MDLYKIRNEVMDQTSLYSLKEDEAKEILHRPKHSGTPMANKFNTTACHPFELSESKIRIRRRVERDSERRTFEPKAQLKEEDVKESPTDQKARIICGTVHSNFKITQKEPESRDVNKVEPEETATPEDFEAPEDVGESSDVWLFSPGAEDMFLDTYEGEDIDWDRERRERDKLNKEKGARRCLTFAEPICRTRLSTSEQDSLGHLSVSFASSRDMSQSSPDTSLTSHDSNNNDVLLNPKDAENEASVFHVATEPETEQRLPEPVSIQKISEESLEQKIEKEKSDQESKRDASRLARVSNIKRFEGAQRAYKLIFGH